MTLHISPPNFAFLVISDILYNVGCLMKLYFNPIIYIEGSILAIKYKYIVFNTKAVRYSQHVKSVNNDMSDCLSCDHNFLIMLSPFCSYTFLVTRCLAPSELYNSCIMYKIISWA